MLKLRKIIKGVEMPFLRKNKKELSHPKHTVAMPKTHHEVLDKARLSRREQVLSFQMRWKTVASVQLLEPGPLPLASCYLQASLCPL